MCYNMGFSHADLESFTLEGFLVLASSSGGEQLSKEKRQKPCSAGREDWRCQSESSDRYWLQCDRSEVVADGQ